jgi:nucleoside phosphorylase
MSDLNCKMGDPSARVSVVVATALALEFVAVEGLLTDFVERVGPEGTVYRVGYLATPTGRVVVAIVQTGTGNTTAAIEAERSIQLFHPTYFLFVGIAGGIKDVGLGDVVAASKIYAYESGKSHDQFLPRPEVTMSGHALVQRAMAVARDGAWVKRIASTNSDISSPTIRAFVGPIAAGEKVLASRTSGIVTLLKSNYSDALAVEMEGYGAMRAAFAHAGVQALVIRGISDSIAGKSESDRRGWQEKAAAHAAAFAAEVICGMAKAQPSQTSDVFEPDGEHRLDPAHLSARMPRKETLDRRLSKLNELAPVLYPTGPLDRDVWARAGGDVSRIDLSPVGRTAWRRALALLTQGGGGAITIETLIQSMVEDFPMNEQLAGLMGP